MSKVRCILLLVTTVLVAGCGGEPAGALDGAAADPPAARPSPAAGELQERVSFDGLSFQVPARWISEAPGSRMRMAQYRVPQAEGDAEDGECALFVFPGTGGTVEANLKRWYGQISQPDGGSTEERARVERFEVDDLAVTLVDVSGTYSGGMMGGGEPKPDYRMVAGIVETADSPWFLKCTGPEGTMVQAEPEVRALLGTVRP